MPAFEHMGRTRTALLWEVAGTDDYGQVTVHPAQEIMVRWNQNRRETVDANGNPVALDAEVHVAQKIGIGSIMWLGTLDEFLGTGSGSYGDATELYEVKTYEDALDIKGRNIMRVVGLTRHSDSLPTIIS